MAPTRSTKALQQINLDNQKITTTKRKAEGSPRNERNKRAALGNLTNALKATDLDENTVKKAPQLTKKSSQEETTTSNGKKPISSRTRGALKSQNENEFQQPNQVNISNASENKSKSNPEKSTRISRRISNEFEKTEDSLYVSALEEIPSENSSTRLSNNTGLYRTVSNTADGTLYQTATNLNERDNLQFERPLPPNVEDFDRENWRDIFQVSTYAMNIFEYLKMREKDYQIKDYMSNQPELSKWMRSLLIDWMVEVQESFELNHETLYLAVKIVDSFLGREKVTKDCLQLLGAAALLIACKYDERTPPLIEDFLFICDGAYKRSQLLKMEMTVFKAIEFDLSFPLSYRFLRRYARCGKISMVTLTLARYILEYSLMDYATIQLSDSKLACAALFISLRMNDQEGWNATYEYYSGYKLMEFAPIVILLNSLLHRKPKENLSTVRNKYSHKIFHQVTTIPLMDINKLFTNFPDVAKQLSSANLTYQSIIASCGVSSNEQRQPPKVQSTREPLKKTKSMPTPLLF